MRITPDLDRHCWTPGNGIKYLEPDAPLEARDLAEDLNAALVALGDDPVIEMDPDLFPYDDYEVMLREMEEHDYLDPDFDIDAWLAKYDPRKRALQPMASI